jgi:hypothetical protein
MFEAARKADSSPGPSSVLKAPSLPPRRSPQRGKTGELGSASAGRIGRPESIRFQACLSHRRLCIVSPKPGAASTAGPWDSSCRRPEEAEILRSDISDSLR